MLIYSFDCKESNLLKRKRVELCSEEMEITKKRVVYKQNAEKRVYIEILGFNFLMKIIIII
jgi:hypothetical protein